MSITRIKRWRRCYACISCTRRKARRWWTRRLPFPGCLTRCVIGFRSDRCVACSKWIHTYSRSRLNLRPDSFHIFHTLSNFTLQLCGKKKDRKGWSEDSGLVPTLSSGSSEAPTRLPSWETRSSNSSRTYLWNLSLLQDLVGRARSFPQISGRPAHDVSNASRSSW